MKTYDASRLGSLQCSQPRWQRVMTAQADPVADFYKGKTVRLIVGYGPGGSYDLYGRLAAEFLGRHIPGNPTVVPVNMPGAGGIKAVDYLYKVAPQDGTHLGSVAQQMAMTLVGDDKMGIDPTRFKYLGRLTSMIDVAVATAEDRHHLV